ncbi:Uncharacterized protein Rs2_02598 [Raphanus sativus]|nr:Uncharacterized protein Rs2_02598 [Raphanus sativus]
MVVELETETMKSDGSCYRRVDGVRDPGLEEEIAGSSSCGGEQRDEAAELLVGWREGSFIFREKQQFAFKVLSENLTALCRFMATSMQPQSFNGSLEDKLFEAGFKELLISIQNLTKSFQDFHNTALK